MLVATPASELAGTVRRLLTDGVSREITTKALDFLDRLFAAGPEAPGSRMAGRAEEGVGQSDVVVASVSFLAQDLLRESTCGRI